MYTISFGKRVLFLLGVTLLLITLFLFSKSRVLAQPSAPTGEGIVDQPSSIPTFAYETILNLAQFDAGRDIAVDDSGHSYVVARAYDSHNDVLIVKLDQNGLLQWHTYLRGNSHDFAHGIALDAVGNVYVAGATLSTDFPVLNAWQDSRNGPADGFITKLSGQDGSLLFSTYFGGSRAEYAQDIALDAAGNVYITGYTDSTDLPTVNPIQPNLNLTSCFCDDAFVAKFDSEGTTLLYGTYLGGAADDKAYEIDIDSQGNIHLVGTTRSPDWPLANAIQTNYGGNQDVFASQLSSDGLLLNYSTYLGGNRAEYVLDMVVNDLGAYLIGRTPSIDYPTTAGAFQEQHQGGMCGSSYNRHACEDLFVTKLHPNGTADFSTFIGGDRDDVGSGITVDSNGRIHLIGYTDSSDFPLSDYTNFGLYMFVSELNETGSELDHTLSIFSSVANDGHGIIVDNSDNIYITGGQNAPADLYIAKLAAEPAPPDLLRSTDIALTYHGRGNKFSVMGDVMVATEQGTAVANATVDITWTLPDGTTIQQSETTDTNGIALFKTKGYSGTYTLHINTIIAADYTFDPTNSILENSIIASPFHGIGIGQ